MARDGPARRRPQDAAAPAGRKAAAQDRDASPAPTAVLTVADRPVNTRPYPWLTAAPELRPPARPLPSPLTDSREPAAATAAAGPAGPDDGGRPEPLASATPSAGPAIATAMSELLFVVARYLSGTPCQRAFQALVAELNEHRLLPPAISWTGEPRALTYADLVCPGVARGCVTAGRLRGSQDVAYLPRAIYRARQTHMHPEVGPDYLPRLLERLMALASSHAPGVPAGLSSPLAGVALFHGERTAAAAAAGQARAAMASAVASSLCTPAALVASVEVGQVLNFAASAWRGRDPSPVARAALAPRSAGARLAGKLPTSLYTRYQRVRCALVRPRP